MTTRDRLFVSYAHEDWDLVRRFVKMLRRMSPPGEQIWWDEEIAAGDRWRGNIERELDRAHSCLLFVSLDFLDSEFIQQTELPNLIASDVRLLPLLARDCPWDTGGPLGEIQWLHDPGRDGQIAHPDPRVQDRLIMQAVRRAHEELSQHGFPLDVPEAAHETAAEPVARAVETLQPSAGPGPRLGVPPLPRGFEDRPAERRRIAASLLAAEGDAVGVTGRALGLHGQGGLGKSILAAAIAWDDEVAGHFPDGVAWVSVGEFPDLLGVQRELGGRLGIDVSAARSVDEARTLLADGLVDRALLLVADDVWSVEAVEAFRVTGPRGRVLYTTRDDALLTSTGVRAESIGVLDENAARGLLARVAGLDAERLPEEADDLLALTDRIALAVVIAGSAANPARFGWRRVVESLREGLEIFAGHPYAPVFAAMRVGFDHLGGAHAEACRALAVFPEEARVPRATVRRLWAHERFGLDDLQSDVLVKVLAQRNMVSVDPEGGLSVHDLLRDFLLFRTQDRAALHATLLGAYEPVCAIPGEWASLPLDEPYIWPRLVDHLVLAGRHEEMRGLLDDLAFVAVRIHQDGVHAMERDLGAGRRLFPDDPALGRMEQFVARSGYLASDLPRPSDSAATVLAHVVDPPNRVGSRALACLLPSLYLRPRFGAWAPSDALLKTLGGHRSGVAQVAFGPDGRTLASVSDDGTARLWDTESGAARILEGHVGRVTQVAFSPNGRTLASASYDNTLRLWDAASGHVLLTLKGHQAAVVGVAFSPDGRTLASASWDNTVRLWDTRGEAAQVLEPGHSRVVSPIAFSPDGRTLAMGCAPGALLWDIENGAERELEGPVEGFTEVVFSPDGRTLASVFDTEVWLWDIERGAARVLEGHMDQIAQVIFSPDGSRLASASSDRTVRLWDAESDAARVMEGRMGRVTQMAFSPDGRTLAAASDEGTVELWDSESGTARMLEGQAGRVAEVALSPDGRTLASVSYTGVWLRDTESGTARILEGQVGRTTQVAFSPDGRTLAAASDEGTVELWDSESGTARMLEGHVDRITQVAFSPDGRTLASASWDHTVRLWNTRSGAAQVLERGHAVPVTHVTFSPDGRTLAGASGRWVVLWDTESGAARVLQGHLEFIAQVVFSPDGGSLASASEDGTVRLWNTEDGAVRVLEGHTASVDHVAFSPDGRTLVSVSIPEVGLWPLEEPEARAFVRTTGVFSAAFAGQLVALGVGRTVMVFDLVRRA